MSQNLQFERVRYNRLMQPHVTCAFVFTHYLWVSHGSLFIPHNPERVRISYQDRLGRYVNKYYHLSNFTQNSDHTEYKITAMMSNGGDHCEMTIRRRSARDDAEVIMEHGVQHRAGLRHEFTLAKRDITDGRHYNSEFFRNFTLRLKSDSDPKKFAITSEALTDKGNYTTLHIEADIE